MRYKVSNPFFSIHYTVVKNSAIVERVSQDISLIEIRNYIFNSHFSCEKVVIGFLTFNRENFTSHFS